MSENRINIFERGISLLSILVPAVPAVIGAGVWLIHLESSTNSNTDAIADVKAHVERIDDSRRDGLQRLATVEEAVKGQGKTLDSINAKLDRALDSVLLGRRSR